MSIVNIKCKHCNNNISFNLASNNVTCEFCGSTYSIQELLDEKDILFLEKLKPEQIEDKIEATSHIKTGEALIYQANYIKAEEEFKKAIELDKTNHHAYFGVVKAKTHNLTIIPTFDGYIAYAKDALKYAEEDDKEHIKSELNKLKLLEKEHENQKKLKQEKQALANKKETKKRKRLDLFSKVLYIIIFALTAIALVAVVAKSYTDELRKSEETATVEITTSSELINFMTKKEYLSATIVLKNDINLYGTIWTPVGNASSPFTGKFYGGGHTISNLSIKDPDSLGENYLGLFGYAKGATITGIKLDSCKIEIAENSSLSNFEHNNQATNVSHANFATNYAGLIVARADNSDIKLCEISNTSKISITNKTDANLILGGVIGFAKNSEINHCTSHAEIVGSASNAEFVSSASSLNFAIGGIVGKIENSGISYSYSSSTLSISVSAANNHDKICLFAGGVIGFAENSNASNFYARYLFFTGNLSAKTDASLCEKKMGAIISSSNTLDNISNNFAFCQEENFNLNDIILNNTELYDNSLITFAETEEELILFISEKFSSEIWENTNTLLPNLKSA